MRTLIATFGVCCLMFSGTNLYAGTDIGDKLISSTKCSELTGKIIAEVKAAAETHSVCVDPEASMRQFIEIQNACVDDQKTVNERIMEILKNCAPPKSATKKPKPAGPVQFVCNRYDVKNGFAVQQGVDCLCNPDRVQAADGSTIDLPRVFIPLFWYRDDTRRGGVCLLRNIGPGLRRIAYLEVKLALEDMLKNGELAVVIRNEITVQLKALVHFGDKAAPASYGEFMTRTNERLEKLEKELPVVRAIAEGAKQTADEAKKEAGEAKSVAYDAKQGVDNVGRELEGRPPVTEAPCPPGTLSLVDKRLVGVDVEPFAGAMQMISPKAPTVVTYGARLELRIPLGAGSRWYALVGGEVGGATVVGTDISSAIYLSGHFGFQRRWDRVALGFGGTAYGLLLTELQSMGMFKGNSLGYGGGLFVELAIKLLDHLDFIAAVSGQVGRQEAVYADNLWEGIGFVVGARLGFRIRF